MGDERPDIETIKALEAQATPGPWGYAQFAEVVVRLPDGWAVADIGGDDMSDSDGFFIAAARTAVPQMVAYIEALEAAQKRSADAFMDIIQIIQYPFDTVGISYDMDLKERADLMFSRILNIASDAYSVWEARQQQDAASDTR
jgi:hypothetical protein